MRIARLSIVLGLIARGWSQDQPTFSADVNVVSILATVRDKGGRIVKDLNMEDFVLFEDGAPQKIRYFSRETDLPLAIGLLVDTSRSQVGVLWQEGRASWTFLEEVLRPTGIRRSSRISMSASRFFRASHHLGRSSLRPFGACPFQATRRR